MITRCVKLLVFILMLMLVISCGKSAEEKKAEEAAKQLEEAGKQMAEGIAQGTSENMAEVMKKMGEALSQGSKIEPVNFRELKALLPESLPGMKRTNASGEKTASFGINVSEAEGSYDSEDGGSSMNIKIVDMGSISGLASMATFAWAFAEFDREDDSGYEKTTKYDGYKAFEKYNKSNKKGEIQVLIAKRFMVEVDGYNVDIDDVKKALGKIDLDKLEKMKNYGVQK